MKLSEELREIEARMREGNAPRNADTVARAAAALDAAEEVMEEAESYLARKGDSHTYMRAELRHALSLLTANQEKQT